MYGLKPVPFKATKSRSRFFDSPSFHSGSLRMTVGYLGRCAEDGGIDNRVRPSSVKIEFGRVAWKLSVPGRVKITRWP